MDLTYTKPSILIVSSSNTKPKSLIKLITHSHAFENADNPNIVSGEWEINTKYYTANVNLYGITEHFVRTDDFNIVAEALIILMDSNNASGLKELDKWSNIENDCSLEIKLLVSNYFTTETKISKTEATKWCLKRGFELVELYPSKENSTEESDSNIIEEKTGVERIIEALQTHVWTNLVKKTATSYHDGDQDDVLGAASNDFSERLNDILTTDGVDDFTELFSQIRMFKQSLVTMSNSERKQNAEELVTKFWHAIGGDEEELADV